jgi:hypothetical protein
MKKGFIMLMAVCGLSVGMLHAQEMAKGDNLFSAGIGLVSGWGLNASYDYGIVDTWGPGLVTIGGHVGFSRWGHSVLGYNYHISQFALAPRATYRYQIDNKFEVYGVLMLGMVMVQDKDAYRNNYSHTDALFGIRAGGRYMFQPNMSLFAELGYGVTWLNCGLSFAF